MSPLKNLLTSALTTAAVLATTCRPCLAQTPNAIRIATFNTSLNRCLDNRTNPCLDGGLAQALADPSYRQAQLVAETIQRVAPDIVLLSEFNYDASGKAADLFQSNFLSVGQNVSQHPEGPANPIQYPYRYLAPSNTGITSGFDFDNNGRYDGSPGDGTYGNDAFGFGEFAGRYGMLLLSKYPIATDKVPDQRFRSSYGVICRAYSCPTILRRPIPPTGIRQRN